MAVVPLIAPSVAVKWEDIALVLGIGGENSCGEIDTIKTTHKKPTECFAAVIQRWISGCSGKNPKTWGTFKIVLTQLNINFSQSIEKKVGTTIV